MVVPPVEDTQLREIRELSTITLNWIYHTFPYVGSRGEYEMIANRLHVIVTFNVSKLSHSHVIREQCFDRYLVTQCLSPAT